MFLFDDFEVWHLNMNIISINSKLASGYILLSHLSLKGGTP